MKKLLMQRIEEQYIPEPNSGCWLWIGATSKGGYGNVRDNYRQKKPHRVTYENYKGPIPPGFHIDHKCRNPACINPDHLEAVTPAENSRRGLNGALKTHCKKGHPLSGANVLPWRGMRLCRACRSNKWLRAPARLKRMAQRAAATMLMLALAAAPAFPHDWYEPSCCGGGPNGDCAPVPDGDVQAMPNGYAVTIGDRQYAIAYERTRVSQDRQFHACISNGQLICLYAPLMGS